MADNARAGVAVVTGAGGGIGEACARRFASDGRAVACIDINGENADAVARTITEAGGSARAFQCDVVDIGAQQTLASRIEQEMGPVDLLFTSAGLIVDRGMLMTVDLAEHARVWDVNYHGTLYSIRAFAPAMQKRKRGAICTVSSVNSYIQLPLPAYNPGKVAVKRLTELLAMELGRDSVRINSVAPGYTLSENLKKRIEEGTRDPEKILGSGAIRVYIEPKHIAAAAAWLCSDEAEVITGVTLPVDAGYLCAAYYQTYAGGLPWED